MRVCTLYYIARNFHHTRRESGFPSTYRLVLASCNEVLINAFLEVAAGVYSLPGLNCSCNSAHQSCAACEETFIKPSMNEVENHPVSLYLVLDGASSTMPPSAPLGGFPLMRRVAGWLAGWA